jgi:hypothetical protein
MNAKDLLKTIVVKRNWHNGMIERKKAAHIKKYTLAGTLSYEKACEVLILLGFKKIAEEEWEKESP